MSDEKRTLCISVHHKHTMHVMGSEEHYHLKAVVGGWLSSVWLRCGPGAALSSPPCRRNQLVRRTHASQPACLPHLVVHCFLALCHEHRL